MAWSWLTKWLRPGAAPAGTRVVMYTRRGCPLCEDAWALLRAERPRFGYALEAADVDADPDLASRHGPCVPVVTVNGRVRFRGRVNVVLLRRLLRAEARRPRPAEPPERGK